LERFSEFMQLWMFLITEQVFLHFVSLMR
jgi:hypothetical protein